MPGAYCSCTIYMDECQEATSSGRYRGVVNVGSRIHTWNILGALNAHAYSLLKDRYRSGLPYNDGSSCRLHSSSVTPYIRGHFLCAHHPSCTKSRFPRTNCETPQQCAGESVGLGGVVRGRDACMPLSIASIRS